MMLLDSLSLATLTSPHLAPYSRARTLSLEKLFHSNHQTSYALQGRRLLFLLHSAHLTTPQFNRDLLSRIADVTAKATMSNGSMESDMLRELADDIQAEKLGASETESLPSGGVGDSDMLATLLCNLQRA